MKIIDTTSEEFKGLIDNKEFFGEGLADCYVIRADKFGDERGFFSPMHIQKKLEEEIPFIVFEKTVQENESGSLRGVIRGLHYQLDPKCQSKLVRISEGEAVDVIVDVRQDSPTFKKWLGVRLRPYENQLIVPKGFAHGFIALDGNCLNKFHYLVDNDYTPSMEDGIPWDDPSINIDWDTIFNAYNIKKEELITSEKDKLHSTLDEKIRNNELTFKRSDLKKSPLYYNSRCRVMVTGGAGQLGYDVIKELEKRGYKNIYAPTRQELDITNKEEVNKAMQEFKPDVVIHSAAYTAVDNAEDDVLNVKKTNVDATEYIADNCKKLNSKLIFISTDYVFDGEKSLDEVYETTDLHGAKSVYGRSKIMAERKALNNPKTFIVRTSWVFGINGKNFVKTMLRVGEEKKELPVVSDQYGSPTYTVDLAKLLVDMSETEKYGLYHANNSGYCNWAEFAEEIFRQNNMDVKVNHITSDEYPQKANRPKNSKLSKSALVDNDFEMLPAWQDALRRYIKELKLTKE